MGETCHRRSSNDASLDGAAIDGRRSAPDLMTSPLHAPDTSRLRLSIVGVIVICLFAALFARLWYLQVMDSEALATKVVHNATRTIYEPAPRGRILDRNGNVLVDNRHSIVVTLDRQAAEGTVPVDRPARRAVRPTVEELDKPIADLRYSPYRPVPLVDDVTIDKVAYIKEHSEDFPSDEVGADRQAERSYPTPTGRSPPTSSATSARSTTTELKAHKGQGYRTATRSARPASSSSYERRAARAGRAHGRRGRPPAAWCCARSSTRTRCRATTCTSPSTSNVQKAARTRSPRASSRAGRRPTGPATASTSWRPPARSVVLDPATARCWRWRRTRPTTPRSSSTASRPRSSPALQDPAATSR